MVNVVSPDDPPHAHRFGEERIGVRQAFEFVSAHCDVKLPVFQIFPVRNRNAVERTQTAGRKQKHRSAIYSTGHVKAAAIFNASAACTVNQPASDRAVSVGILMLILYMTTSAVAEGYDPVR